MRPVDNWPGGRKNMAPMKQPSDEIDEDAPTTVFVRPIRRAAHGSAGGGPMGQLPLSRDDAAGLQKASLTETVGALSKQVEGLTDAVAGHLPLVDLRAAAEHLGVSTRTLRRMVAAEAVPYRRFGRTLRFSLTLLSPARRKI
jgi:excisionase family DNA binding protein